MRVFVTFGQVHLHVINGQVFDKDCIAVIDCEDHAEGRAKAFELFGRKFCVTYGEEFDMHKILDRFPRGLINVAQ